MSRARKRDRIRVELFLSGMIFGEWQIFGERGFCAGDFWRAADFDDRDFDGGDFCEKELCEQNSGERKFCERGFLMTEFLMMKILNGKF